MTAYRLCKAIHHLYINREAAMAARAGRFATLDQFELADDERRAIEHKDFVALYRLGVHPLLLFHLAVVLDSRDRYVREVVPQLAGLSNPFYDYYARHERS